MLFTFLLLFIFVFLITGYHPDPVRRLRRARDAAGGGGPAVAPPPGPRLQVQSQTAVFSGLQEDKVRFLSSKGSLHISHIFLTMCLCRLHFAPSFQSVFSDIHIALAPNFQIVFSVPQLVLLQNCYGHH